MPREYGPATEAQKRAMNAGREKAHVATRARAAKRAKIKAANPNMKSRHAMLLDGTLDPKDLDDEELKRGRGRDIDGEFKGNIAAIPIKVVQKVHAEIFRRHGEMMRSALVEATATLIELANNPEVKDEIRIKAANILIERNAGKVPQDVRVGSIDPWEQILEGMLADGDDAAVQKARERLGRMAPKSEDE